jgi:transposase InsO family protein
MNTVIGLRREFVILAKSRAVSFKRLCSDYQISRKTGYKWLKRYSTGADEELKDRPRRPLRQRERIALETEQEIVHLRQEHPVWGARKLRKLLERKGRLKPPAKSTVNAVLKRNGLIDPAASSASKPFVRFERPVPNSLWQMDFKGWFNTLERPCHPLTVLDDHSRFAVCVAALPAERSELVQARLEDAFAHYGLPDAILTDNGSPWGSDSEHQHTVLGAWLMKLGIEHVHSRPYHPQTAGKDERFHRTLKLEVIDRRQWRDLAHCQEAFDEWRPRYNTERPHEALGDLSPAERYRSSLREYTGPPQSPEYPDGALTRKVDQKGRISFQGRLHVVGKAFRGERVMLGQTEEGRLAVLYGVTRVATLVTPENTQKVLPMCPVRL